MPAWLFDPQTWGGLLAGVAPAKVESILATLLDAGCIHSAHVGEIVEKAGEQAVITLV